MSETPMEPHRSGGRRVSKSRAQRKSQGRVVFYMFVLFAAAFVLLLMAFLMQHRANQQTIDDLTDSMQQSVTSIHSLQNLVDSNNQLQAQVQELEDKLRALEISYEEEVKAHQSAVYTNIALKEETDKAARGLAAMDWFWQVNEAFVKGRYSLCRSLIATMEEQDLVKFLPEESVTDNGRFSPADRYEEICQAVN